MYQALQKYSSQIINKKIRPALFRKRGARFPHNFFLDDYSSILEPAIEESTLKINGYEN